MEFPAWDPVLISIPYLPIDVRWYGLMYIVGFLCGQFVFVRLARVRFFPVAPEAAPDLIFYCVVGVMLGGRTGYALFYDQSLLDPFEFVKVWKGGLAFHGGLGGVAVAMWLFCRRHQIRWGRVADAAALGVCPGIFCVRMANFINGELYGRATSADTMGAMQFPTDPRALQLLHVPHGISMRDRELALQIAYGKVDYADVQDQLSAVDDRGAAIDWQADVVPYLDWQHVRSLLGADGEPLVPYRHPSQVYEGLAEGLLLGLLLWAVYLLTRRRPLAPGRYGAIFLLGYAVARISLETVRKPDDQFYADGGDGTVLFGMTMGQTLSVAMVVAAVLLLLWPKLVPARDAVGDAGRDADRRE